MAVEDEVRAHPTLALIGNTPMVELPVFRAEFPQARVLAKIEAFNPGGSIKDRPVLRMLIDALDRNELRPGMTILDSSSGNAGIAYAMIGGILGFEVEIVMPGNASTERKRRIAAHGAACVYTDAVAGYDEAMREARRRHEADPERTYFADQYGNESNWMAHYDGTAAEILAQAPGRLNALRGRRGHGRNRDRGRAPPQGGAPRRADRVRHTAGVSRRRGPQAAGPRLPRSRHSGSLGGGYVD